MSDIETALDALCEALSQHDAQFNPELEQIWRESMGKGIALMTSVLD